MLMLMGSFDYNMRGRDDLASGHYITREHIVWLYESATCYNVTLSTRDVFYMLKSEIDKLEV